MSDFETKAKQALDRSVNDIDDDVARRLRLIRYQALEQAVKPAYTWRLPATAFTSIALIAITTFVVLNSNQDVFPELMAENLESPDIMVMNENIELLEELEFMQWLELNSENAS